MTILVNNPKREFVPLWQAGLCLLLAALFLYNPFMGWHAPSSSPLVCHPASYRGTIAASELEQFAPVNKAEAPGLAPVDVALLLPPLEIDESAPSRSLQREVFVPLQTPFSSGLWFRPPPVA